MSDPNHQTEARRLIGEALALLDLAAEAGSNDARFAVKILKNKGKRGRPKIDDTAAVAEIRRLEALGKGRKATAIVARRLVLEGPDGTNLKTIKRRLQRKRKCAE